MTGTVLSSKGIQDKLLDILQHYGIYNDFKIGALFETKSSSTDFIYLFCKYTHQRCNELNNPINIECFIFMLAELSMVDINHNSFNDVIVQLIKLLPFCMIKGRSISILFDLLRSGVRISNTFQDKMENLLFIPLKYHHEILTTLQHHLIDDNPMHLIFPGDKESFLKVSSIPLPAYRVYTMTIWLKLDVNTNMKGFLLYRCRTNAAGVDVLVTQQADGTMELVIRSNCENKLRDEARCVVNLQIGKWHFITIKQIASSKGNAADRVSVLVDANVELESELLYPFITLTNDSIWMLGLGMKGLMSSVALYPDDLPLSVIQLLLSLGPNTTAQSLGTRYPQSSFDTGHLILGTMSSKGAIANKLCKYSPLFYINPLQLLGSASNFLITPGYIYPDHIDLQPRTTSHDEQFHCTLVGSTVTSSKFSGIDAWFEASGCSLALYLLWEYSTIKFESSNLKNNVAQQIGYEEIFTKNEYIFRSIYKLLQLTGYLILSSTDLKEQFIQLHGFHIVGYCLSSLPSSVKKSYINIDIIDACFALISSLGVDSYRGDGIAAALQGLLFDFRIWGSCDLESLKYYLQKLSSLLVESGLMVYKCIGVQRILDIFRLQIIHNLPLSNNQSSIANDGKALSDPTEQSIIECADCVHRLLIVTMEAAQNFSLRMKQTFLPEAEILLKCLEETNNGLIAERILRLVGNLRVTSPLSLIQSLNSMRYHDTVIIPLLTKKGFSIEVRSNALVNLFWLLGEELKGIPNLVIHHRKVLNSLISHNNGFETHVQVRGRKDSVSAVDSNRAKSLIAQIREEMKPIEKGWITLMMISDLLSITFEEGNWGNLYPSYFTLFNKSDVDDLLNDESSIATTKQIIFIEINSLIRIITHSGNYEAWMLIPLLPVLLSRSDIESFQTALMSINVAFKTNECHSEALSCLRTSSWIKMFISLSVLGELHSMKQTSAKSDDQSNSWSLGSTCSELSLDCLSIVLDYKTRTQVQETKGIWNILQRSIKSCCKHHLNSFESICNRLEQLFLKRCVVNVLHRIVSYREVWSTNHLLRVIHILSMIDSRSLCGFHSGSIMKTTASMQPVSTSSTGADSKTSKYYNLDEVTHNNNVVGDEVTEQTIEETQIMCFVFDIMCSLRKAAVNGALQGIEWRALKISMRITLNILRCASESVSDRIIHEILAMISYLSENWAPITGEQFKSLLILIFNALREAIHDQKLSNLLQNKYAALVFAIMHFFIDKRHYYHSGGILSDQVLPVLDALAGVDSCSDITLIFKLLDVSMNKAENISFEENEIEESEEEPVVNVDNVVISDLNITSNNLDTTKSTEIPSDPITIRQDGLLINFEEYVTPSKQSNDENLINLKVETSNTTTVDQVPKVDLLVTDLTEDKSRDQLYLQWVKVRLGISVERVDSERARLSRSMDTIDLTLEATKKFWRKAIRKVESELFNESHVCQWKIGVAHEGPFYGRRRIIERPRFDGHYRYNHDIQTKSRDKTSPTEFNVSEFTNVDPSSQSTSPDQLNRALAKAFSGYIKDVTRCDSDQLGASSMHDDKIFSSGVAIAFDKSNPAENDTVPGTGWGLVDADGSDDGFGVIGIAPSLSIESPITDSSVNSTSHLENVDSSQTESNLSNDVDMLGDIRQLEENAKQGKGIETGPCHTGTKRIGSGSVVLESRVLMITASGSYWGNLSFNGKEVFFCSVFEVEDKEKEDTAMVNLVKQRRMRRRRWVLSSVSGIYLRRFRLRDSALEVFFRKGKHRNFFVDFGHTKKNSKDRDIYARALMLAAPPTAFKQIPSMSAIRLVYEHKVQEKWIEGKLSNFDYLMALNTLAGRSYNDLCQYPVMPWIISDYTSSSLDLTNPSIYRDLSKPMGALNENRLKEFLERFENFEDNVSSGIPPFMYGSHYSTMVGVVLHFLVRLQPFAALHREMQNGHFDVPDRLFSSVPRSFKHNTTQLSEVKELIPEWYTTPDMFRNVNHFNLGQTQDGELVDDVELPPWANSPEEFVRISRAALESDYVSEHLHEWIDLIFGYKQRGPDAVEAYNVFYYLTYYGSVNHYMIEDESLRLATELQIAHFGQTPMQLFKVPHPSRKILRSATVTNIPRLFKDCYSFSETNRSLSNYFTKNPSATAQCDEELMAEEAAAVMFSKVPNTIRIISTNVLNDRIICVLDNGVLEVLKYNTSEEAKTALVRGAAHLKVINRNRRSSTMDASQQIASTTSKEELNNSNNDIIVLDDTFDLFNSLPDNSTTGSTLLVPIVTLSPPPTVSAVTPISIINLLRRSEPSISISKENSHFEVIPRIPIPMKNLLSNRIDINIFDDFSNASNIETPSDLHTLKTIDLIIFRGHLVITAGHMDGRVCVREYDRKTGFVKASADFMGHKRKVISISSDSIPTGNTDVMATCDESGLIMVWTILKAINGTTQGGSQASSSYVISRRPQRLFHCDPHPSGMICKISWHLGVIVAISGNKVSVYSIERDELIRSFYITSNDICDNKTNAKVDENIEKSTSTIGNYLDNHDSYDDSRAKHAMISGTTGPQNHLFGMNKHIYNLNKDESTIISYKMVLSDFGIIVVYIESTRQIDSLLDFDATHSLMNKEFILISFSVSGHKCGILNCSSPVTCMSCPDQNEYILLGYSDGTVTICCALSLHIFYSFQPHLFCVTISPSTSSMNNNSNNTEPYGNLSKDNSSRKKPTLFNNNNKEDSSTITDSSIHSTTEIMLSADPSPIISIDWGPNTDRPAIICIVTQSGKVYLKAFPDFIKWEKGRTLTTLQQLTNVPIQAMKGTIIQAQNWTSETAGVIAQNARSLADDALVGLKKSKLAKGVVNFFGFGKSNNNTNDDDSPSIKKL